VIEQEEGHWLTSAQAGQRLGISPEAVRQLARRRGWPRRTPNAYGGLATVLVPGGAAVRVRTGMDAVQSGHERGTTGQSVTGHVRADKSGVRAFEAADMIRLIRETMEGLVTPLREQLDRERVRADRAESLLGELQAALTDAVGAERIAAGEAAGLRTEVEERRSWGFGASPPLGCARPLSCNGSGFLGVKRLTRPNYLGTRLTLFLGLPASLRIDVVEVHFAGFAGCSLPIRTETGLRQVGGRRFAGGFPPMRADSPSVRPRPYEAWPLPSPSERACSAPMGSLSRCFTIHRRCFAPFGRPRPLNGRQHRFDFVVLGDQRRVGFEAAQAAGDLGGDLVERRKTVECLGDLSDALVLLARPLQRRHCRPGRAFDRLGTALRRIAVGPERSRGLKLRLCQNAPRRPHRRSRTKHQPGRRPSTRR